MTTLKLQYHRGQHNSIDITTQDGLMLGIVGFTPFFGVQFKQVLTSSLNAEDAKEINFVCGQLQKVMG